MKKNIDERREKESREKKRERKKREVEVREWEEVWMSNFDLHIHIFIKELEYACVCVWGYRVCVCVDKKMKVDILFKAKSLLYYTSYTWFLWEKIFNGKNIFIT